MKLSTLESIENTINGICKDIDKIEKHIKEPDEFSVLEDAKAQIIASRMIIIKAKEIFNRRLKG